MNRGMLNSSVSIMNFYLNEEIMFKKFVNLSYEYIARAPPGNVAASAKAHIGVKQGHDFVKARMM